MLIIDIAVAHHSNYATSWMIDLKLHTPDLTPHISHLGLTSHPPHYTIDTLHLTHRTFPPGLGREELGSAASSSYNRGTIVSTTLCSTGGGYANYATDRHRAFQKDPNAWDWWAKLLRQPGVGLHS